jgi:predicted DNA-binding protein (UPF0251 family)
MTETLEETRARILALVSGPGKTSRWITKYLDHADEDWCLIYPFAWEEGAYPKYRNKASGMKNIVLHRLMCEYRHGQPPTPKHHSAHSCNRGVQGCVNPMHVSWKTATENQLDRKARGVAQRAKLTTAEVDEIRALQGRERPIDLAKKFNVSLRNIRFILSGQAWRSEEFRGRHVFTADEVRAIRMTPWQEKSAAEWAKEFGVHRGTIDRIKAGQSYKYYDLERAPYIPPAPLNRTA